MMEAVAKKLAVKSVPTLRFGPFKEEWNMTLLGELARVTTGDKDTQNRKEGGHYPFFVRSDTVERIDTYSYEGKAILTSGDGVGVGKNFHYIDGRFDFHQRVYCICDFALGVDAEFVYHYFSQAFYRRVMRMSAKNSVDSVRRDMVVEMPFPRPTLPEQQNIASFLSAVDAKVRQLTRKKALLEQYKKGVMQQLFSQELRFKRMDGTPSRGASATKGAAYPEWEEKRLGSISKSFSGGTPRTGTPEYYNGTIQFIRSAEINSERTELHISEEGLSNCSSKMVQKGDLLFAMYGATAGEIGISRIDGAINQAILCIRLKKDDVFYIYSYFLFMKERILSTYLQGGQGNLSGGIVNDTMIPLPSLEEQQRIAGFLMALDAKVAAVGKEVEAAQRWKKGLLQQMFV